MADSSSATRTSTTGLSVSVVTPEQTVLETAADSVVVPLFDGELGILTKRRPMIGRLGFGEMRLTTGGETTRYYVDGGFVQVADDVVSILTAKAAPIQDLDLESAKKQLEEGLAKKAAGEEEIALRDRALSQARAQVRLASKS